MAVVVVLVHEQEAEEDEEEKSDALARKRGGKWGAGAQSARGIRTMRCAWQHTSTA